MASIINALSSGAGGLVTSGDTSGILQLQNNSSASVTLDASGNVGIGTTSPGAKLETFRATGQTSGTYEIARFTAGSPSAAGTDFGGQINLGNNGGTYNSNAAITWAIDAGQVNYGWLAFKTANAGTLTERMRIDYSGNVLVGKTASDLAVAGAEVRPAGYGMFTVSGDYAIYARRNTNTGQVIAIRYAGTDTGSISTNGTNTAYATSSDYRLKENIAPMSNALNKILQLKPVTYTWKSNGVDSEGFIAHELAEVCPQAVIGEKDAVDENGDIKPQGIDTSFIVATLVASIQELKAIVDAQQQEINALKGETN